MIGITRTSLVVFAAVGMFVAGSVDAAFVLTTASVNDVLDPDDNPANMAAGAFSGNDAMNDGATGIAQLISSFGDIGWTFLTDTTSFSGDPADDPTTGTFILPVNISGTFAISLKADGGYSLYKFIGDYMAGDEFSFDTAGVAVNDNNGKPAGLSHVGLYSTATSIIPEFGSFMIWAVLGSTICGISGRRRRV